jgi:hypothetical protein
MNGIIECHFGEMHDNRYNIVTTTSKASLCNGSENWIINKRDTQKLKAAQMKFLRPWLGHPRLDSRETLASVTYLKWTT